MIRPADLFSLALLGALPPATARAELRVVAMEGYSVPGEAAGTVYGSVGVPLMNAAGDVAFTGRIGFADGRTTDAVYRSLRDGGAEAIAHAGQGEDPETGIAFPWPDETPHGISGATLFQSLSLNGLGSVAFGATLPDPPGGSHSIYGEHSVWRVDSEGQRELVIVTTEQAPDAPDGHVFGADPIETFTGGYPFRVVGITDQDDVSFIGHLADSNSPFYSPNGTGQSHTDTSIWKNLPGSASVRLPNRIAQASTDDETEKVFRTVQQEVVDGHGTIAFVDRSVDAQSRSYFALYRSDGEQSVELVAAETDRAPGLEAATRFVTGRWLDGRGRTFSQVVMNGGHLGFVGAYGTLIDVHTLLPAAEPVDTAEIDRSLYFGWQESGVWTGDGEQPLTLVTHEGQAAPGISNGVFSDTALSNGPFASLTLNDSGEVAFVGSVRGETDSFELLSGDECSRCGVWVQKEATELDLISKRGDQPPGMEQGSRFLEFGAASINANGQIAFMAFAADAYFGPPYYGTFSGSGIWAHDSSGVLKLIAREGEQVDINDDPLIDDFRTIQRMDRLAFQEYREDEPASFVFNDQGEIAFWAEFTDGTSGVFVSSLVAVPEPTAVLLTAIGAGLATCRRPSC